MLESYLEYWRLKLRIEDAAAQDVQDFLARNAGSYLAERLRLEWLKELGRRADWPAFDRAFAGLREDDLELRCHAWSSRLARGDGSAYAEADAIWREAQDLPEGCARLAERLIAESRVGTERIWK